MNREEFTEASRALRGLDCLGQAAKEIGLLAPGAVLDITVTIGTDGLGLQRRQYFDAGREEILAWLLALRAARMERLKDLGVEVS